MPGQSIRERWLKRLARHIIEVIVLLFLLGITSGIVAAAILSRYWGWKPVTNLGLIGCAVVFSAAFILNRRLDRTNSLDNQDRLGIAGERVVAEALDDLKRDGYRVFHDVPPEREAKPGESLANYDHLIVGPAGVFVIETKTRSKLNGANKIVVTADARVLVNGLEPDRCPLKQAQSLARAMRDTLASETAMRNLPVRPVVIFPGWWIEDKAYRDAGGNVWTLNEIAFAKWVRSPKECVRLKPDAIALLASRLEQRVRATGTC